MGRAAYPPLQALRLVAGRESLSSSAGGSSVLVMVPLRMALWQRDRERDLVLGGELFNTARARP